MIQGDVTCIAPRVNGQDSDYGVGASCGGSGAEASEYDVQESIDDALSAKQSQPNVRPKRLPLCQVCGSSS